MDQNIKSRDDFLVIVIICFNLVWYKSILCHIYSSFVNLIFNFLYKFINQLFWTDHFVYYIFIKLKRLFFINLFLRKTLILKNILKLSITFSAWFNIILLFDVFELPILKVLTNQLKFIFFKNFYLLFFV